jgi:hypothetical protein
MSQETAKPKYIIVLGTTYSGSGAVYDYLAGRGDLHDPLSGSEYLLPQAPGGLMTLEAAAGQAFHHAVSDHAVVHFLKLARKLARSSTRSQYGKGYAVHIPDFLFTIENFIHEVTSARMPMHLDWQKLVESNSSRLLWWLKSHLGRHRRAVPTHILVSADELVVAAQAMHDRLFQPSTHKHKPILLNQTGSGWNPIDSTKYFDGRKVVLVTRDPRDQFAELKEFKGAGDVEEYIKWFQALRQRIAEVDKGVVLKLPFEEFVCSNRITIASLCDHLGLNGASSSSYQVNLSEKNIGKYGRWLTTHEIERIEAALL